MRKKRSLIWKINKLELQKVVDSCNTFTCILKHFNLLPKGGNTRILKEKLKSDKINFSHIPEGVASNRGRTFKSYRTPLENILTKNSSYNRYWLKKRLLNDNIIKNECAICKIKNEWNNKPLTLQLDHINGVFNDNTLKNLRLLCPNCHSQTDNFSGKTSKLQNNSQEQES